MSIIQAYGCSSWTAKSLVGGLVFLGWMSHGASARAATITVNGTCSLAQAVTAVNNKAKVGGCAAGTGGDTIVIPTTSVTSVSSLLTITRSVTIQSAVPKTKAEIAPATGTHLTTLFSISPLAGTAASVAFVDVTIFGDGNVRAIDANGRNSTDKLTLTRTVFSSLGQSAVATSEVAITISDSYFQNNTGSQGGALFVHGSGNNNAMTISNSSFIFNNADEAGAIYDVSPTHSTITNCTFSQNSADVGGALGFTGMSLAVDIMGSTIANNVAYEGGGGGISAPSSVINLTATILAGNNIAQNPGMPSDWNEGSPIALLKDSLLGSSTSFDSSGSSSPIMVYNTVNSIVDTPDDFGQVVGIDAYDLGGDQVYNPPTLRLPPTSPAVDWLASTSLATDQRGYVRGVDAPGGNGGNRFDIGAFEYDPNLQVESLVATKVNQVTSTPVTIAGFLPTLGGTTGKGIQLVPTAVGSSISYRMPLVTGGGAQSIILHIQSCPTCGTYQIALADEEDTTPTFVSIGTQSFASSTTKVVSLPALSLAPFDPSGFGEDDVIDIRFTLVSKPSGSNGQAVIDYIKMQ